MMSNPSRLFCEAGDLIIDENEGIVTRDGEHVAMPHLSWLLLLILIKKSPAVVSSSELIELVWKNKVVSDETIQQRIKLLRQSLSDNSKKPLYIATLRGQGYKFVAPITILTPKRSLLEKHDDGLPIAAHYKKMGLTLAVSMFALVMGLSFYQTDHEPLQELAIEAETENHFKRDRHSNNEQARRLYFNAKEYLSLNNQTNIRAAIMLFEKALALDPLYALAHVGLSNAASIMYSKYQQDSRWLSLAQQAANSAIGLEPMLGEAQYVQALSWQVAGDYSQAIDSYHLALDLKPDHYAALNQLSLLYKRQRDFALSLEYSYEMVRTSPRKHIGYVLTALTLWKVGELAHASEWLAKARELAPQDRQLQYLNCQLKISQDHLDLALKLCNDLVDWQPDTAWGYEWIGEVRLLQGNIKLATELFKKAMDLGSNYSTFRYASLNSNPTESLTMTALLERSEKNMIEDYLLNHEDDAEGTILNLLEYYGATNQPGKMVKWFNLLLETDYTQFRYFLNNSCFQELKESAVFLSYVEKFRQKEKSLRQQIPTSLIISPAKLSY
jgi:DNA-binding winged helix-turn-helix (wHTH) protein/tetratricopeptide (TPR) repeat protein